VAHFTGTTKFKLDAKQREELKKFVNDGGTLIVEAAGGSADFADSAETELAATFGAKAAAELAKSLTADHALYSQPDAKIEKITYRDWARRVLAEGANAKAPRIKGHTINGRVAVFFSREDLTGGLVGQSVDGIVGYSPATSTAIMRNMILYGLANGKGPVAAAPAQ
jgi:predicted Zn-dependent protease